MGSKELSARANWQTVSGALALKAEDTFRNSLQIALDLAYPDTFEVDKSPKDFKDIYSTFDLPESVKKEIYNVDMNATNKSGNLVYEWGISMDFAIRNLKNKKTLFGEIKRQNGWVENTEPKDGRGNAHERSTKYFTPGLKKIIREKSNIKSKEILPFWIVFIGNITRDPKRNREIAYWFQGYEKNFFMWRDTNDIESLLIFFEENLLDYLK